VTNPGFTIVLPLRNGGALLRECVSSVLAQTHPDFELVVLENASTDGGPEWLAALGDSRVRVAPAPEPLPIEANWGRIVGLPRREFMTLIGHDDRLAPGFLAEMAGLIARHPGAGLYRVHARIIDAAARVVRAGRPMPEREDAASFLRARLRGERDSYSGCVMRSADYDRAGGMPRFPRLLFADDALWLALIAGSYAATSPATAFDLRMHEASQSWAPRLGDLLDAWDGYASRLAALARDPDIEAVLRDELPGFLESRVATVYLAELKRASAEGRRLEPQWRVRIRAALARAGADPERFARRSEVRLWEAANASPARRLAGRAWETLRAARRGIAGR